jgi:hypothetical protein
MNEMMDEAAANKEKTEIHAKPVIVNDLVMETI